MKEPKFPKLEDIPKDHKYDFFAEGVFPDTEDEKQNKNLGTQKKSRLPFSLPVNAIRKVSNTQKEDDLVPFFAKNYPSSSESKEEVCFINSPSPSDTPDNTGEAEEVDIDESEEDENENNKEKENKDKKNKNEKVFNNNKKLILNNEDLGVSIDFNSEMENEYENPSKMMSREEVQELRRIRKLKLEKEEAERKKKEEELKKKEEEKKKREEELKKKNEEEKKKKEKEKEQKEKEKEQREKLKKIEDEKKKKIKSNKKDPLNMLSSIKKNYDDNSNMASNSMINDVQNFFAIPEEKGENEDEDEDTTKKNFKKNSKESEKKSKSKSKKIPKSTTVEEEKDKQSKEKELNKNKKNKLSRKSNGLKVKDEEEKKFEKKEKKNEKKDEKEKSDSEKEEEYSNYGDQLADVESGEKNVDIDSDSPPKKQKVKEAKKSKKTQNRKKVKKINKDNSLSQIELYQISMGLKGVQKYSYDIVPNKETKTFGNGRYPVRNRVRALRHELGERAIYEFDEDGLPNLKCLDLARNTTLSDSINKSVEALKKKKMKKKLVKGLKNNNNETIPEESNEYNSENLNSDNISEFGEDDARILKIPKGGKKSLAKNYDTVLVIKIIEAHGKNLIRVDKEEYKNLKNDNQVKVGKNQEFEILNFSENFLVVQLVFDENN